MQNLSIFINDLIPKNQLELIITGNTDVIAIVLFVTIVFLVAFLIVRNYRRNFTFGMNTFRENFEHEKMHWEHLRSELSIVQTKLNDLEKEKIDWGSEKQNLLKTIADLEEQVKNFTAQTTTGQDDIIIEYYMNQSTVGQSSDSAN